MLSILVKLSVRFPRDDYESGWYFGERESLASHHVGYQRFPTGKLLIWPQVLPLFQNSINPFNTKQANKQIIQAEDHVPQKPRDLNFSIANLMFQCVFGYLTFEFGACATPRIPLRFHDQFGASFCLAQINGRQVFLFIFHVFR